MSLILSVSSLSVDLFIFFIVVCYVLVHIELISIKWPIYEENSLGPDTELPYFIIPGKEDRDALQFIGKRIEQEFKQCLLNDLKIELDGHAIEIIPHIKFSQADGE